MAKTTRVTLTEAKRRFGELWKRVAYGGEHVVVEVHGKPLAVIQPYVESVEALQTVPEAQDLPVLREPVAEYTGGVRVATLDEIRARMLAREDEVLAKLDALREQIAARGVKFDVSKDLEEMRQERSEYFDDLR